MCKAGRDLNELNEEEEDYDEEHEFDSDCDSVVDSDDEYEDIDDDGAETQVLVGSGIVAGNDIERVDCIAHKINTVIERTLKKKNHFRPMITKSKKLVVSYRRSSKAKSILKKYYEKRLAGFVKTRWWSLLFMLKSVLLALKAPNEAIDKLIDEMQWGLRFTDRDIRDMDLLIGILSPFEELFSKLNGENYSTIQRVYPSVLEVLEILKNRVEDQSISVGAKNFCSSL